MRVICLLLATAMLGGVRPPDAAGDAAISAQPIALDPRDPARVKVGALTYLGGWVLGSRDPRFGGISALVRDGGDLIAISDRGGVFRIRTRGSIAPRGIVLGPLPDGPPERLAGLGRDAESATRDSQGTTWVGFEGANAIWRYDTGLARATGNVAPPAMARWPGNGGPEAMVRLSDGRFLIFSEEAPGRGPGTRQALLFAGDPVEGTAPVRFDYRPPEGYVITDVRQSPDGRLIALHRRYTRLDGVSAILSIVDTAAIREGAEVEGQRIALLAPPLTVDNMEALEIERDGDSTILWIASDDNFSSVQRTLLLRFRLN